MPSLQSTSENPSAVAGCLVGQAIGDMTGLPYENLSPRRVAKLASLDHPRFFFGYGCGSDDTEHMGLTAEAIAFAQGDVSKFRYRLASGLRRWFLAGPPGIGLATAKACIKLCLGFSSTHSGVFSAGNGPAMRAAILGLLIPPEQLQAFVEASTRITHTDPRAFSGSLIIARLAAASRAIDPASGVAWLLESVKGIGASEEPLLRNLQKAAEALTHGLTVQQFAESLCPRYGVSGFVAHTVPVAVFAFFRHADDYRTGIENVILSGGDTDTVAAITGALIGSRVGVEAIPIEWRARHRDWPWSLRRLVAMNRPVLVLWPLILARNLAFFLVVLCHIARRFMPPW